MFQTIPTGEFVFFWVCVQDKAVLESTPPPPAVAQETSGNILSVKSDAREKNVLS